MKQLGSHFDFNILPTEQPNIQEEPHGTSQPPAKRLTPIADRMRAREKLAERDIRGQPRDGPQGQDRGAPVGQRERGGGGGGAVILLRYSRSCSLYTSCRVSLSLIFTLLVGWESSPSPS